MIHSTALVDQAGGERGASGSVDTVQEVEDPGEVKGHLTPQLSRHVSHISTVATNIGRH